MVSVISSSYQEWNRSYGRTFWVGFEKTEDSTSQLWAFSCGWGKTVRVISGATSFSAHMQTPAYLRLYSGCAHLFILMINKCAHPEIWTAPMNIDIYSPACCWQLTLITEKDSCTFDTLPFPDRDGLLFSFECRVFQVFSPLLLMDTGKWSPHAFYNNS